MAQFNLGNVLAQAEQIKGLRNQNDPANPQNRLAAVQLQSAENQLDEQAKLRNTKELYQAYTTMAANPQAIPQIVDQLKARGVIGPEWQINKPLDQLAADAGKQAQALAPLIGIKPQSPVNVAPGNALVDPSTGREIYARSPKSDVLSPEAFEQRRQLNLSSTEAAAQASIDRERAKAAAETKADQPRRQQQVENKRAQVALVQDDIKRAMDNSSGWTTGFFGNIASYIPGTPAHDLAATLDSIKANIGFDKLSQMRAESKTGGALGQVTERELALLQAVWGSVAQSQSEAQFERNLARLSSQIERSWKAVERAYQQDYGMPYSDESFGGDEIEALIRKYSQ